MPGALAYHLQQCIDHNITEPNLEPQNQKTQTTSPVIKAVQKLFANTFFA